MRWFWIDRFIEFVPGSHAKAVKNVTLAEEHLHDHFPGFPIMPGSLMLEGMAQTAGILVGEARNFQEKVILAKVGKATFHRLVRPGDTVYFNAKIDQLNEHGASISGTVTCGSDTVAEIEMMFTIAPGASRDTMSATAACIRKKGPRRLTAMCWSNSSGVVSSRVPRVVRPAEFTSPSIRP